MPIEQEKELKKDYYQEDFYKYLQNYSRNSAEVIVPLVLDMIPCNRVVDVGCGDGTWLKVFQEHGVQEVVGVDGEYVNEKILVIPKESFIALDLKQPIHLEKKFDLVVSLEVAEHLPSELAATFVNSLTKLGSVILFSAAIPHQGGVNHINEQWQDYWVELFQSKNYVVVDCMRRKIWNDPKVAHWYSQNMLMFAEKDFLEKNPFLKREYDENRDHSLLRIVHPILLVQTNIALEELADKMKPEKISLRQFLSLLPEVIKYTLIRKLRSHRILKSFIAFLE